tara:strand:+ start:33028 stop:33366 length:339 start_codon:yes stop_codon:yes gene_type:complete
MIQLSGENWSGCLLYGKVSKASGKINGYPWLLLSKRDSLIIEIAEDPQLTPEELPLVGYGCGGWLYESEKHAVPENEQDFIIFLNRQLLLVFTLFKENKLNYLPAVSCPCSE